MSYDYQYIDSAHSYIDPISGILRNIPNLSKDSELIFFESTVVSKRLLELELNPVKITNSESLLEIHQCLFQDVYEWAGKIRTVNISKDGKPFFEGERFQTGFQYINSLILEFSKIPNNERSNIAEKLAEILDNINFLHPFREGNGRTQREFIRTLALQKGFSLNLNPPNNKNIYDRYMRGTIESDLKLLADLIQELLIDL
jgi:cell filamentation protein